MGDFVVVQERLGLLEVLDVLALLQGPSQLRVESGVGGAARCRQACNGTAEQRETDETRLLLRSRGGRNRAKTAHQPPTVSVPPYFLKQQRTRSLVRWKMSAIW